MNDADATATTDVETVNDEAHDEDELVIVDPNLLTLQEVEDFEEAAGLPISAILNNQMSGRAVRALVWVMKRREDPSYTMQDAGSITLGQFVKASNANPPNAANG